MHVLIVEGLRPLGRIWRDHMARQGLLVELVHDQEAAITALQARAFEVVVLDLVLEEGSALAVADFASYRHPGTQIVFVSGTGFFSDGSIFSICANARALLHTDAPPEDLTAMVAHYGGRS